ncbi:MAG: DUF4302 domain-containing protein [Draconibacterium sp.]|nr:DUF4302 domain-containing protein [Draconibacterium sp.]
MKKLIINTALIIFALTLFVSCEDELDNPFPDERLNPEEQVTKLEELLIDSEFGWKSILKPEDESVGGYNFVVKFKADGTSEMASDYYEHDNGYETLPFDGLKLQSNVHYTVKKVATFELAFETYCFIHKLYDKNISSTFQYVIESYNENEIVLADGESKMVMTKATENDWDMKKYFQTELIYKQFVDYTILFSFLHKGNDPKIQISNSFNRRSISFYYFDENDELQNRDIGYYYTENGMVLRETLHVPGMDTIREIEFVDIVDNENSSKILNVIIGNSESQFYSGTSSYVPNDDGIEHFLKIEGISLADGGRFWSSRTMFEGGFRYGSESTYFGLEDDEYFSEFDIFLGYYNARVKTTYNFFSFAFGTGGIINFYDVYFTFETSGSDQIVFKLDEEIGESGYSSHINPIIKEKIEPMLNKLFQAEGFSLFSNPHVNPIDNSISMYLVDNKDDGFMYMQTGVLY